MDTHIPIEEIFAKANFFARQSSWISGPALTGVFQFTKLPTEIKQKIIEEYIHLCSPHLSVIKYWARLPVTQDLNQQAKPSRLLNNIIANELEASLYTSLLVSKTWYIMVAGFLLRNGVYIDGYFNLQRLLLFEKRCHGFGFGTYAEEPVIDKSTKVYTFGLKCYLPDQSGENKNGWTTNDISGTSLYFDCYGRGPWWKHSKSYHISASKSDIDCTSKQLEAPKQNGWAWIPNWALGGSSNTGGHLNYGRLPIRDKDDTIKYYIDDGSIDGSIDNSIINFGSIVDDESIEDKESMENTDSETDPEPGSFLVHAKTLILGPGVSGIHKSDIPHCVSSLDRRQLPHDPEEMSIVPTYYRLPGTYLLHRMLGESDKLASVQNMVISGHIWSNPWLFAPRSVRFDFRFPNLKSLTLCIPCAPHKEASPMRSLRYFQDRCADRHLCMLLTGRQYTTSGEVVEKGSTFLNTLEYLHIRGPGAHCCSEVFEADWKKLNSVTIELPTTAAICEAGTKNLIMTIEKKFLHRRPKAEVHVNLRTIMPWFDSDFGHYFWRLMKDHMPTTSSYPGKAYPLAHSTNGVNVTLFRKKRGEAIVRAHEDWIAAIDNIRHEEQLYANAAEEYFNRRDGVDIRTMVWEHDRIWITAENEATEFAVAEENSLAAQTAAQVVPSASEDRDSAKVNDNPKSGRHKHDDQVEEPDYTQQRLAADDEFMRQNQEYLNHIIAMKKQGYIPQQSPPFF
ncbi:hypothetical protein C7212DRAFT_224271 [Tuber magnatum]|uniref:Uncharacterized protein n=1 Tax=Tuber magnatum TaxID=42249 RepID=A0A317SDX7_9PEZI|nr:hypothetical protein C7212DRAFT_224271 [Tuber magnatum]